jgi:esterase/lipase superfamily enzyme
MHHEHAGWHSPSLNRYMHLQVFGHAGARVMAFPTTMGTHSEWPDRRMHEVLREHLDNGWIQLYCLDQVHDESWYNKHLHPGVMAWRHLQYLNYVAEEVLPFSRSKNDNPFVMATGASFGAYHAASLGFRYPERVHRIIGMSGNYDIKRFTGGYSDENVYACNPFDFMQHEHDPRRLAAFRAQDIILAIGQGDPMYENNRAFSAILWEKGIGNALRVWNGWAHDWPYWEKMISLYVGGHD